MINTNKVNKSNYIIRDYEAADYEDLMHLWKITGLAHPERGDDRKVIEKCLNTGGKLLVMADNKNTRLIGSSWMTNDGRRLHLHHFAIHPDFQNQGLGKILTEETLRFVREMDIQVKLEVHKDNHVAKHLYLKFGFVPLAGYEVFIKRNPRNGRK